MQSNEYSCTKCNGTKYNTGALRTTGSGITRFLNIQNQKYTTISCNDCGYTEIYRANNGGKAGNILDFLTN
jgi:predicted nucleic-acid-binding Zn-ribbon protein